MGARLAPSGGFASAGAACDKDVGTRCYGFAQRLGLIGGHDAGRHIVVECEYRDGRLSDGEGGRGNDGRQQAFKPFAGFG